MKGFFHPVIVTLYVVIFIISLPFLLPEKRDQYYMDETLREMALSRDMGAVPANYEVLLKVIDTPENPMSREKIALGKELFFDTELSQDKTISCASCHNLKEGGDDNLSTAIGYLGAGKSFSSELSHGTECGFGTVTILGWTCQRCGGAGRRSYTGSF